MGFDDVFAMARRQHALFTTRQADSCGVGKDDLDRAVRAGRLTRVRRTVYAVAGAPRTRQQALLAVVLSFGPGAVLSHESAAVVWSFPNVADERIEVTSAREHRVRLHGVTSHRTVAFLEEEHTVRDGVPVTTVARTLVDLSARMSVLQLGIATDDALRRNVLTLAALRRCVDGLGPAPGRRPSRIHDVLAARLPGYDPGDSDLEVRVLRAIVVAGLPQPVQQHWVRLPNRRCRIDLAYPAPVRLAIEVDGYGPHATRSAFDRDRARANELVVAGWTILRFTSASTDDEVSATVASALARLGQLLAV